MLFALQNLSNARLKDFSKLWTDLPVHSKLIATFYQFHLGIRGEGDLFKDAFKVTLSILWILNLLLGCEFAVF
jgi:hypothetical protein